MSSKKKKKMSAEISTQDFFMNQKPFFDQVSPENEESPDDNSNFLEESGSKRKDSSSWSNNQSVKVSKKPGRKPDTTIPATKRKAQNRAAQRAFRERKEKHVKDLEDRVTELEDEAAATNNENEFLKSQVERLQSELEKFRSPASSPNSNRKTSTNSDNKRNDFTFEYPFFGDDSKENNNSEKSSPFSSYKNTVSPFSTNNETPASSLSGAENNNNEDDEENTFCDKLSLACGNTDNPVPAAPQLVDNSSQKNTASISSSSSAASHNNNGSENAASGNKENNSSDDTFAPSLFANPPFDFDFLSSYRDPLFDNTGTDFNLPELSTTEFSVFDPLESEIIDSSFDSFGQITGKNSDSTNVNQEPEPQPTESAVEATSANAEDDSVPAPKSKFMSCSAVWDRVSSHPKFNDLDIEGLCSELRSKVKCSDSGILLTENDVENVLSTLG